MKLNPFLWLLVLFTIAGCAAPSGQVSRAKQPSAASLADAAAQVYSDIQTIEAALQGYRTDNGDWPTMTNPLSALVEQGYLAALPEPIAPVFWSDNPGSYHFDKGFDNMDGGSTDDIVLRNAYYIDAFCRVFIADYASELGNLRTEIFDYEATGNTYPGEILGKDAIIYAIKYGSDDVDRCELHWVMEYKD